MRKNKRRRSITIKRKEKGEEIKRKENKEKMRRENRKERGGKGKEGVGRDNELIWGIGIILCCIAVFTVLICCNRFADVSLGTVMILRCHLLGALALATPSLRFCAWASPASFIEKFSRILSDMADPFVSFDQQRATALRRHATIRRSRQVLSPESRQRAPRSRRSTPASRREYDWAGHFAAGMPADVLYQIFIVAVLTCWG
jgi:hypothetical protein